MILFGSHARGEARPHSDVDFLVVEPEVANEAEESVRTKTRGYLSAGGEHSVDWFHRELGKVLWDACGMARSGPVLEHVSYGVHVVIAGGDAPAAAITDGILGVVAVVIVPVAIAPTAAPTVRVRREECCLV